MAHCSESGARRVAAEQHVAEVGQTDPGATEGAVAEVAAIEKIVLIVGLPGDARLREQKRGGRLRIALHVQGGPNAHLMPLAHHEAGFRSNLHQIHAQVKAIVQVIDHGTALEAVIADRAAEEAGGDEVLVAVTIDQARAARQIAEHDLAAKLIADSQ